MPLLFGLHPFVRRCFTLVLFWCADNEDDCGDYITDMDFFGNDIAGARTDADSTEECLETCLSTPNCNGWTLTTGGVCHPKELVDGMTLSQANVGTVTYRVCPEDVFTAGGTLAFCTI